MLHADDTPPRRWINGLLIACSVMVLFGSALVLAPALARQGFSLLVYGSPGTIERFGSEQVRYLSLAHAVIGGVMIGWGMCLFMLTRALLSKGSRAAWNIIAVSLGSWFVPDTVYSLISGYWQNALLNLGFLLMFAVPLLALRPHITDDSRV